MDANVEARIDAVLAQLTVHEQAALTAGEDVWHTPAVERLGVGRVHMSDGPSGVRGDAFGTRRSLSFPCGMAAGATWDVELLGRYGRALAEEASDKGVHVLLGPTVCIPRTPLGGRTFESFTEDPHLSARLTVAYVAAVQARGVVCCVKHFACNDQEHERMTISVEVDERSLREIHLVPFEAAVREAGAGAIMSAYNKVNGTYCSEHPWLLTEVLRGDWGFDGVVVSDWLGTHSTVQAATAGLDIEMPGPASHLGSVLAAAVEAGEVDGAVLREMARRSLRLRARTGLLGGGPASTGADVDDPGRRAVARELVVGSTVLLRNDGVLPLASGIRTVAVIGPNGDLLQAGGGGSSQVAPHRTPSFVDELAARLPAATVTYEPGCDITRGMPAWDARWAPDGFALEFRARGADGAAGELLGTGVLLDQLYMTIGSPLPGVATQDVVVIARARVRPASGGLWQIGLSAVGATTVCIDDRVVIDNSDVAPGGDAFFGIGRPTQFGDYSFEAGRDYDLVIEARPDSPYLCGFEIGAAPVLPGDLLERAVAAAAAADTAVVVVGSNRRWESEGADRVDLHLPGEQDELVRRVVAANPRTVVVLNAGSPVDVRCADGAAGLLSVWYPGEEGAPGLADVVTGVADPGGRLPITFPRTLADVPASGPWYPGADGKVTYGEGLLVGYRHYDTNGVEPEFAFGHGLSYTSFDYGVPTLQVAPDGIGGQVTLTVTNTGERAGSDVVQVYVHRADAAGGRPDQELRAFAKVRLAPGATTTVALDLDARAFAHWDVAERRWRVPAGDVELRIASSSRSVRHRLGHRTVAAELGT